MEKPFQVLPLLFVNGNPEKPQDPKLFEAVQQFCEQEFGKRLTPTSFTNIWVSVTSDNSAGYVVEGITGIALALDCPLFHVQAEDDQDKREHARTVRDALMMRAASAVQDKFGHGAEIMVHVEPEKQRFWAAFLKLIGAKAANRFVVKV